VSDTRIIRLIGLTLRSGVLANGTIQPTLEGTTQGSPLSPLLSNIVLDELDKELEKRGLSFCRFADDCNIFVKSQKAAERVMASVTKLLEQKMKLVVNREKSKIARTSDVKFLGITIILGLATISAQAMEKAMAKIQELTPRRTAKPLYQTIEEFSRWYHGWSGYFQMTHYPNQFVELEGHARRRLRAQLARNLKHPRNIAKAIVKAGLSKKQARKTAYSHNSWWVLSHSNAFERMYPNKWFQERGMFLKSQENHPHWFAVSKRICIS
jgi:RNA-directed DNA polymerase